MGVLQIEDLREQKQKKEFYDQNLVVQLEQVRILDYGMESCVLGRLIKNTELLKQSIGIDVSIINYTAELALEVLLLALIWEKVTGVKELALMILPIVVEQVETEMLL